VVLATLYFLGTEFGGIGLGWIALHPGRRPLTAGDQRRAEAAAQDQNAQLSNVQITTPDGVLLRAWFIRPAQANGSAVILLHGVGDNRLGVYGYGDWLMKNHYSVLLPDARAHGLSGGELATYGIREADDIHEWVNWLEENHQPSCVFGFGESMGAAQLLQSVLMNRDSVRWLLSHHSRPFAKLPMRDSGVHFIPARGWVGRSSGRQSKLAFFSFDSSTA